jgi:sugar phosphate isomerase/epimerase
MDRRTFLGTMTAATLMPGSFACAADEHKIEKVGIQLGTVRDQLKQDFAGTLAKIANMGYREVELGPYVDKTPKEVRATLDRLGLAAPSTHLFLKDLDERWPAVLEMCQVIGHRYVVIASIDELRKLPGGWNRAAEAFNRAGEKTRKAGIQLTYHNHWRDFVPPATGKLPYDILLDESDPSLVKMEMDLCWIIVGGGDPLKYFARYPGRFPMVHVKDVKKIPDRAWVYGGRFDGDYVLPDMTEVGNGIIDWKRIFAHSEQAGIKHYFMEHDEPKMPMECARISCEYLQRLRF